MGVRSHAGRVVRRWWRVGSGALLAAGALATAIVAVQGLFDDIRPEHEEPRVTLTAEAAPGLVPLSLYRAARDEPDVLSQAVAGDLSVAAVGEAQRAPVLAVGGVPAPGPAGSGFGTGTDGDRAETGGSDAAGDVSSEIIDGPGSGSEPSGGQGHDPEVKTGDGRGDDQGDGPGDDPDDDQGDGPGDDQGDDQGDGPGDDPDDDQGDGPGDGPGDGQGDDQGDGPGDDPGDDDGDGPDDDDGEETGEEDLDERDVPDGDDDGDDGAGEADHPGVGAVVHEAAALQTWQEFQTDVIAEVEATSPSLELCHTEDCRLALLPMISALEREVRAESMERDDSADGEPDEQGEGVEGDGAQSPTEDGSPSPVAVEDVAEQLARLFDDVRTTSPKPDGSYEPLGVLVDAGVQVEAGAPGRLTLAWALSPSGLDASLPRSWVKRRSWALPDETSSTYAIPLWVPVPARQGAYEARLEVWGDRAEALDRTTVPLVDG
jgi:hypothetical protein